MEINTDFSRRVSVHAVGISTGDPSAGQLAKFMKALAEAFGQLSAIASQLADAAETAATTERRQTG